MRPRDRGRRILGEGHRRRSFRLSTPTRVGGTAAGTRRRTRRAGSGRVAVTDAPETGRSLHAGHVHGRQHGPVRRSLRLPRRQEASISRQPARPTSQRRLRVQPAGASTYTTIGSATTTVRRPGRPGALADGLYDVRAIATDRGGHTGPTSRPCGSTTRPDGIPDRPAAAATVGGTNVALPPAGPRSRAPGSRASVPVPRRGRAARSPPSRRSQAHHSAATGM